jgi:hypothetical protein
MKFKMPALVAVSWVSVVCTLGLVTVATAAIVPWTAAAVHPATAFLIVEFTHQNDNTASYIDAGPTSYYYNSGLLQKKTGSAAAIPLTHISASGYVDGASTVAQFGSASGIRVKVSEGLSKLFVVDHKNFAIRVLDLTTLVVSTLAGSTAPGNTDGQGVSARFASRSSATSIYITDMAPDAATGSLYVVNDRAVRRVTSAGFVTTIAGVNTGTASTVDGVGTLARFWDPRALALDSATGTLFIGDHDAAVTLVLRKLVLATGVVSTVPLPRPACNAGGQANGFCFVDFPPSYDVLSMSVHQATGDLFLGTVHGIYRRTPMGTVFRVEATPARTHTVRDFERIGRFTDDPAGNGWPGVTSMHTAARSVRVADGNSQLNLLRWNAVEPVPTQLALHVAPSPVSVELVALTVQPAIAVHSAAGRLVDTATSVVTVTLTNSGGLLLGQTTATAIAGVATFTNLALPVPTTLAVLTFATAALTPVTSGSLSANAQPAVGLLWGTRPSALCTVGVPFGDQPSLYAVDAHNHAETTRGGVLTVHVTSLSGGLSGTMTASFVAGVATFTDLGPTLVGTDLVLAFTSNTLSVAMVPGDVVVVALVAVKLMLPQQPSTTAVAQIPLFPHPVLLVCNEAGTRTTSSAHVVTATLLAGGLNFGTVTATAVAGVATFTDLTIPTVGTHTLVFSATGLTGVQSDPFAIVAGAGTTLVVATEPSTHTLAFVPFATQPQVRVVDASGNVDTTSAAVVTAHVAGAFSNTLRGTITAPTVAGVATFTDLGLTLAGVGFMLGFAAAGLVNATSSPVVVRPGVAVGMVQCEIVCPV